MIPEIGHFALIMALCVAMIQGVVSIAGAQTGTRSWMEMARPAADVPVAPGADEEQRVDVQPEVPGD